jgi:hypothetical protein
MPTISMFFGIIIQMLSFDNKEHHIAHIHARYGDFLATFNIKTADVLAGSMPPK